MKRFLTDMNKYKKYIVYSAKSELMSEVANSYLNWLWWIIEPFCFMLIYAFVFGVVFKAKETYFEAFIFIGVTLWQFFDHMMRSSVKLVKNNKGIVSKVYIPKYILLMTKIGVNAFKMMISMIVVVGMMIWFHVQLTWNVLWIVPILLLLFLFTFSISLYLMHFGVFVEDLSNITNIVLRILLYLTGIFYNIEARIPIKWVATVMNRCNPIAYVISSARDVLLYGQGVDLKWMVAWFVVSVLLCIGGIKMIYKYENSYVKVI
ncbi:MAG: ABC transporter permease [Lachnospiraceae bacterium]